VREIAIRKTLGATTQRAVALLLRDFSKPVVVAALLASPVAYFAAQVYLSLFVHRITMTATPFVLNLLLTLAIAWIAVAGQTWRAARRTPAHVLHYE
jgi:putative ABC transport system permease protein